MLAVRGHAVWAGVVAVTLGVHTVVSLARPMASYRALDLGVAPALLGAIAATYAMGPAVLALAAGRSADRRGGAPVAAVGVVVLAAASCSLPLVSSLAGLLVAMAVLGTGHLLALIGMQAVIAHGSQDSALDQRYGLFAMLASAGQLIGPGLAALLSGQGEPSGITRALVGGGVAGIVTLLFVPLLLRGSKSHAGMRRAPTERVAVTTILRSPGVAPAMVVSLSVLACIDIITVYLPALGEERGWSASTVGALLAARAAGSMVSRLLLGRLVSVGGREKLLIFSLLVAAASVVGLALVAPLPSAFAVMLVAGLALGIGQPVSMAIVAAKAPEAARATALSVRLAVTRIGQVAIPAAAITVAAAAATTGVLVAAGVVVGASALTVRVRQPDA